MSFHCFDIDGPREKEMLKLFDDLCCILKYLYADKNRYITVGEITLAMDADGNLVTPPVDCKTGLPNIDSNEFMICMNELSFKWFFNTVDILTRNGKMEEIRNQVAFDTVINQSR